MFLIYINGIIKDLECPALMFAGDAEIFIKINSEDDIMLVRKKLELLQKWSDDGNKHSTRV